MISMSRLFSSLKQHMNGDHRSGDRKRHNVESDELPWPAAFEVLFPTVLIAEGPMNRDCKRELVTILVPYNRPHDDRDSQKNRHEPTQPIDIQWNAPQAYCTDCIPCMISDIVFNTSPDSSA
jgi:hypothetical protein